MVNGRTTIVALTLGSLLLASSPANAQDQCVELPSGTATINGTVTSQQTSTAVFATVTASAEIDGYGTATFSGFAALGGAFSIQVAAPATYVVTAAPVDFVHAPEFYNGVLTRAAATELAVTPGQTVNDVDFTVLTGATISGTVTAASGGAPLEGIAVQATSLGDLFTFGFAQTDASGDYTIPGLATGPHQVVFIPDGAESDYLVEAFDDNEAPPGDPVNVTAPGVSGIDAALEIGGRVEGTVTGSGGPLNGAGVVVLTSSGYLFAADSTNASGDYSILAPPGAHAVAFSADGFVTEFHDDKASQATADAVTVSAGATTSDVDAELAPSGRITGVVTDATSGDPIEGATVTAYDATDLFASIAVTDAAGAYSLDTNLKTGSYRVGFAGPDPVLGGAPGYLPRFYANKANLAGATAVSVTAPNTTADIDQALTPCDDVVPSTSTTTTTVPGGTTTTTLGGATECGDPASLVVGNAAVGTGDTVTATDGLFILRAGVGLETCQLCICDVNNSGGVSATDALTVLRVAVGQPVTLNCPACE